MINTFIDNELNIHNKLFIKSFLSSGFSICIWTYNVNLLRNQVPFGVKVKDANELVPHTIRSKINAVLPGYFLNYFKFCLLYNLSGCFSNPNIISMKTNLINTISKHENVIFGDDYLCKFLILNRLCAELDENFIKIGRIKKEFPRNLFFLIEQEIFGKTPCDNKYMDYSYRLKFESAIILSGMPFYRDLHYHALENKLSIIPNRHISMSVRDNILSSTSNVHENLNIINTLNYIDTRYIDFNKIENVECPINIIRREIENNGF